MIDKDLVDLLVCPETRQELSIADEALIEKINNLISEGKLTNRAKDKISEPIDGGLITADGKYLYPVKDRVPILLVNEAIVVSEVS